MLHCAESGITLTCPVMETLGFECGSPPPPIYNLFTSEANLKNKRPYCLSSKWKFWGIPDERADFVFSGPVRVKVPGRYVGDAGERLL